MLAHTITGYLVVSNCNACVTPTLTCFCCKWKLSFMDNLSIVTITSDFFYDWGHCGWQKNPWIFSERTYKFSSNLIPLRARSFCFRLTLYRNNFGKEEIPFSRTPVCTFIYLTWCLTQISYFISSVWSFFHKHNVQIQSGEYIGLFFNINMKSKVNSMIVCIPFLPFSIYSLFFLSKYVDFSFLLPDTKWMMFHFLSLFCLAWTNITLPRQKHAILLAFSDY